MMSDRKEENFDFESDLDDELFSSTSKKDSKTDQDSLSDLDLLEEEHHDTDSTAAGAVNGENPATQNAEEKHDDDDDEFGGIGGVDSHAEQSFAPDAFDPASLEMEETTDQPMPDQPQQGLQGLVQKIKESWPYYAGAGCAVLFGIYLVSVILSGTTGEQAKAQKAAAVQKTSSTKPLGLTLQDTHQFKGTLDLPPKEKEVEKTELKDLNAQLSAQVGNLPMTQDENAGTITMDKADMAKLLQGFSQVVNNSVEKFSTGVNKELSEVGKQTGSVEEMRAMRKSIETLVNRIDQYEQKLVKLDMTLSQLSMQLNLLVAQKTAQTDSLTLRAVVPGRAWLVDSQGRTYTVAEGDVVGNFGKIVQIDSDAGRVVTSSGYVFN